MNVKCTVAFSWPRRAALKYEPTNVRYLWERSSLYEQLGEHKMAMDGYRRILNLLAPSDGERFMQLARDMAKWVGIAAPAFALPEEEWGYSGALPAVVFTALWATLYRFLERDVTGLFQNSLRAFDLRVCERYQKL